MGTLKRKSLPSRDRLLELLNYDPKTGIFRWKIDRSPKTKAGAQAGLVTRQGYVTITVDWRAYMAHRLAWLYAFDTICDNIDHKNGNPSDNRLDNLRSATQTLNRANSRRRAVRKVDLPKGVVRSKDRYRAQIYMHRRRTILGYFPTAEEAATAYRIAAIAKFGEYARPA